MRGRDDSREWGQMATPADISFRCTDGIAVHARSSFQTNRFQHLLRVVGGAATLYAPGSQAALICDWEGKRMTILSY